MNKKLIVLIILALLLFSVLVFARSFDSRSFSKNNIVVSKSTDSRFTTIAPAFNETKKAAKADNSEDLLSLLTPPWHSNTTIEKTFQYLDPESLQTIPVQIKVSFKDENTYEINLFNNRNEKYFIKLLFSQTPKNASKKHRLAENEGNRIQQTLLLFASPNTIPAFNENKLTNLFNKKEYTKLLFATKEYVSNQTGCEAYYYTDNDGDLVYCVKKCNTNNTYICSWGMWGTGGVYNIQGFKAEKLCDYCTLKQEILDEFNITIEEIKQIVMPKKIARTQKNHNTN